jgi:hypothetical protein
LSAFCGGTMGSSSSESFGQGTSDQYIPNYPQAPLLQAISQYAFDHANDTYDWGMEQYNKNQGNIDNVMRNALSYASPQRISVDMGMAESGVQQGAEAGRQNAIKDLESYGIDPSSGRYAALDSANRVMASASAAGAGNQQRMADEAAGNAMRNQAIAASLQNTAMGYQAADARNKMLATASSLKYPPLATTSQHTQESKSQSVTDAGGSGGGKSPQEKPPKDEGQQQGGAGRPNTAGGRPSSGAKGQQDQPPQKPKEDGTPQDPQNPLGDPFAPDSGTLAAPGAGPYQQALDPTNSGLGNQDDIASRSGVDAAGNILGEMPTTEAGWPSYGVGNQDWAYNQPDLGNFDYLSQGDYSPNQYDTFGAPMPSMDEFQQPINTDYENAPPYQTSDLGDSSWQVPSQDWYNQQGGQDYTQDTSQDFGNADYSDYGDYSSNYGDQTDYGDQSNLDDYGTDDYSSYDDQSAFDDFNNADYSDQSAFDESGNDYSDTSSTDDSYDNSYDNSYDDSYDDSGDTGDYARGGQVRMKGPRMQAPNNPRRGPPRPAGPPRTGFNPGGNPAGPPRPMMGQRDRPPAPPPGITARAAMPPTLPPRTGYMGPTGMPQAAPPTMMPPQRPPPLGMARGGRIGQPQRGQDPTTGGFVSRSLSPSGGNRTDDVNARLNAGEFVIPKDVAHWKGKEFFYKLIQQARKQHGGGGTPPTGYGPRQ